MAELDYVEKFREEGWVFGKIDGEDVLLVSHSSMISCLDANDSKAGGSLSF